MATNQKLGLIAGNGRFPFLLLDAARAHGLTVVVAAIKEETDPAMNMRAAADTNVRVHWLSLGELSKLIETFQSEGVTRAVMAGQVKHKQIFSSIRPKKPFSSVVFSFAAPDADCGSGAAEAGFGGVSASPAAGFCGAAGSGLAGCPVDLAAGSCASTSPSTRSSLSSSNITTMRRFSIALPCF